MNDNPQTRRFHLAVWRWHFYAGLFVLPFLALLALTGLAMLASGPLERWIHADLLRVAPATPALPASASALAAAVAGAYPHADVASYRPARTAGDSAQVSVIPHTAVADAHGHGEPPSLTVLVNPYTAEVLGDIDPANTPYAWAKAIHGTLLLGPTGDYLIEIAAGFGVLLVVTGVFLWWPRAPQTLRSALSLRLSEGPRRWRNLHASLGVWLGVVLLFYFVSGLMWTPYWGGALVQAWSSLPGEELRVPLAAETHAALAHDHTAEMPWAVAQTPLPAGGTAAGTPGVDASGGVTLDEVVDFARAAGFTSFRVHVPHGDRETFTIAASTIARDTTDPREDRIVHIDRDTGNVLGDIGFADYSPLGKFMAAGIPLHQGDLGALNVVLGVVFCVAVIVLVGAAAAAWWTRRPAGAWRLAPPPLPRDPRVWRAAVALMLVVSLALPLVAATLVAVLALDLLLLSRAPRLAALFR